VEKTLNLTDLKKEATELGLQFSPNIGAEKLSKKIEETYKAKEEPVDPTKPVETVETKPTVKEVKSNSSRAARIRQAEVNARKTRVITIVDNDQRVNNHTTTAVTSCENIHFNLGTMHLPLNTPVEVMQGHIDALRGVEIPQHAKNATSGLTEVLIRKRYSVSYED